MSESEIPNTSSPPASPPTYKIQVKGHLDARWAEWFEGMAISNEADGTCVMSGQVADQAMLHGLLVKIRDLSLPLLTVTQLGTSASD